jgi:multidrug efflux pump subunit AcrA (membrane-fusion protein)
MINKTPVKHLFLVVYCAGTMFASCRQTSDPAADDSVTPVSPVQVTHVQNTPLAEYTELSAMSTYMQKSYVKANINGYVKSAHAVIGKQVNAHQLLFTLITKEARAIGNAVNQLDPAFKFSGVSQIRADQRGFITVVNHQEGDYVQDGEALATISNQNSFVFLLDVPYELNAIIHANPMVELTLPDGEKLSGTVGGALPTVDSIAQTQRLIIKVKAAHVIPEGLIAKVRLTKLARPNAQTLPKSAVLTNETEDEFWVMKLINDSTAIKVPVKKGIANDQNIEILNPVFKPEDKIISTGNYGLADTAKVKIIK